MKYTFVTVNKPKNCLDFKIIDVLQTKKGKWLLCKMVTKAYFTEFFMKIVIVWKNFHFLVNCSLLIKNCLTTQAENCLTASMEHV